MLELKTNCARSKTKASRKQGEREKSWRGFTDLRYLGMGVQVRYAREGLFGKFGRLWEGGGMKGR